VDAREFLGLEATDDPLAFRLPVVQSLCTWGGFLFGGSALGAVLTAMEAATGRPAVWATAQYLSFARPPATLDIAVTVPQAGHQVSQARAIATAGDTEILTVLAALGTRPEHAAGTFSRMPEGIAAPEQCPTRQHRRDVGGESVMTLFEQRLARGRHPEELDGTPGDGRSALWVRLPDGLAVSAAALGILGDFVPFGIGQALGVHGRSTSLDNTLRIGRLVPTEWVLVDVHVHDIVGGFAHGRVHLWAEDGTLLAIASQSAVVRPPRT
jgi:acyl-CoA thioesterase II